MKTVQFQGYGPGSAEVHIMPARVTHWCQVDYNGRYGTRITLDTGREVTVEAWPSDVAKAIEAAMEGP